MHVSRDNAKSDYAISGSGEILGRNELGKIDVGGRGVMLEKREEAKGGRMIELKHIPGKGGVAGAGKAALAVVAVTVAGIGAAGGIPVGINGRSLHPVGGMGIGTEAGDAPQGDGNHHQKENQRDAFCGKGNTHGKLLSSPLMYQDYR